MKERPILFSAPMVRALLDGSKTQTRRVVKPQPTVTEARLRELGGWVDGLTLSQQVNDAWQNGFITTECPYGRPGDRLWVRENFRMRKWAVGCPPGKGTDLDTIAPNMILDSTRWFNADGNPPDMFGKTRSCQHMSRWSSRITLEIVNVRVERLRDISEADAKAEGARPQPFPLQAAWPAGIELFYRDGYAALWESLNGAGSWEANPWVWVVEFKRAEQRKE